ncbi:MAG: hypothetical protein PHS84_01420 [Paludibacter sp.]|nr:hypothetical protein [Paludibacter sp.]
MDIKWIVIAVVLISLLASIIYMMVRNQKDKKEVIDSVNEPEIEDPDLKREDEF